MKDTPSIPLIILDVQDAIDQPVWNGKSHPGYLSVIQRLLRHWRSNGWPVLHVKHDEENPTSSYHVQLTFVRRVQFEKLATGMSHAADFSDALFKTSFVASEIIANQLAVPVAQEVTCMFAGTAWAEVVNHRIKRRKRRRAVGPDIGPVGFLLARRKHLHRCFIGVDYALAQHRFTQCIDQWLESHASLPNPLGQGRASDGQSGATKDFLLPVRPRLPALRARH
ncbi:hypothetical protein PshuTeo2_25910 [Pseudomonas hunanensis]|nr:hypothetical protein [Pseudomonas hunanensis]